MGQIELALTVWVALVTLVASDVPGGYYQTKYDGLDVEDVLNHKRLVHHYAACLLNRGPCPPQGADLKRILPESILTTCLRCTEKQKDVIIKTIRRLRAEYPSLWKELVDYYDPTEEGIRRIEYAIDKELYGNDNDQSNFIGNRFNDDDSANDLAAPVNPVTEEAPFTSSLSTTKPSMVSIKPIPTFVPPSTTTRKPASMKPIPTYVSPTTTRNPASIKPIPTYLPPSTTTRKPASINPIPNYPSAVTETTVVTSGSSAKPLSISGSNNVETVDNLPPTTTTTTTTGRPSIITRWKLTTVPSNNGPPYGWRPAQTTLQAFNIPVIKVDAGIRFLGSVLQTGSEIAGMVLSTVQQVFGGQPVVN